MSQRTSKQDEVVFHALDREAEIEVSERNLPHWYQPDAAIFVTFRLADSLPIEVLHRRQRELEAWLANRNLPVELAAGPVGRHDSEREACLLRLDVNQRNEFKRQSDRLFQQSLDECHGSCLLCRPELGRIVCDAVFYFEGDRYDIDCVVVMPNHVHLIVQFRPGHDLTTVSQSWMRFTARQINRLRGASGALWQPEAFDHIIRSPEQFAYLQNYIADNPRKAHLSPDDYIFRRRQV
jgi:putative transposase